MTNISTLPILTALWNNPITQAEFRHQRYVLETSRSGVGWIVLAVIMLLPALLVSILYLVGVVIGLDLPAITTIQNASVPQIALSIALMLMVTMNVAMYLVVTLITLGLAANSITREKSGKTWDNLLLTNIDARKIVYGKWWASIVALWGDHAMVGMLRLGLAAWWLNGMRGFLPPVPLHLPYGLFYLTPLVLVVIAFTVLDMAFCAALGVAAPLADFSSAVVTAGVFSARLVSMILWLFLFANVGLSMHNGSGYRYLPWIIAALLIYAVMVWGALRVAQWLAVRSQVSPPEHVGV